MSTLIATCRKIIGVCKLVPMLPIVIIAAIPVALMWNFRPWGISSWIVDPSLGQWIIVVLVAYTIVSTIREMVDDIRQGHVGVDILAVVAQLATIAVGEYWAAWVIVVMVNSGDAIEAYAEEKAESSLTALLEAAPQIAHVSDLPGVGPENRQTYDATNLHASPSEIRRDRADDGFRGMPRNEKLSEKQAAELDEQAAHAHFTTVPVEDVRLGDVLVVLPGETVPVDGELLSGSATLDLSNINGEPVPREVYAGARVMSGAINGSTTLTMRASELARDSQYQRILELVSSAQNSRATVVKTADLLAVPFTVISFVIAGLAWFISADPARFAQVLVLATPCPLLIAAPVAYIAGTGRLAKAGILIKTQEVLETLGRVSHIFFDKTGTLTVKKPQVVRVEMAHPATPTNNVASTALLDADHILMYAGVVESYSVHILAKGITTAGTAVTERLRKQLAEGMELPEEDAWLKDSRSYPVVRNVSEESGKGITGEVNGHLVRVGRFAFVTGQNAETSNTVQTDDTQTDTAQPHASSTSASKRGGFRSTRRTPAASIPVTPAAVASPDDHFGNMAADEMGTYVSVDGVLAARIVLKDVPRDNAKATLTKLREMGVDRLSMLTGDKHASADIIAAEVGIDNVQAELLPEDKLKAIEDAGKKTPEARPWWDEMLSRFVGNSVTRSITMMVGDGVNDAPVLAAADIGMAITDGTSTAASESAQVVIMNDDIASVPRAIAISRRTKRIMLQAVCLGLGLAIVGMVCAAFNLIPAVIGALMQEIIDVLSIGWALTALFDRD